MRKFSSYGPIDRDLNYYAPRKALIARAMAQLVGENPDKGGHYITVWAPRQTGKTWVMQQILWDLQKDARFHVLKLNLEHLKMTEDTDEIIESVASEIIRDMGMKNIAVNKMKEFHTLFLKGSLDKPLVLIIDEFDALAEEAISGIAGVFRNIYTHRRDDPAPSSEKKYLLHSVALIGIRSVLGIENRRGSPFNVQRSLHIPNLTFNEVDEMFKWYEKESRQRVEQNVIERLFYETQGQPGLTCWLGELLTEGFEDYIPDPDSPITADNFKEVFAAAINVLPNNNILNIISKVRDEPYRSMAIELFKTDRKIKFRYDDPGITYLYTNGVAEQEKISTTSATENYVRFSNPFVRKRLFNYFSGELFSYTGKLHEPFEDLSDTFGKDSLNIRNLMRRHQDHLKQNREWLLKDAPRRKDLRIFEAVYHFNLYRYLCDFLDTWKGRVYPEFPTGNGKIDIIIEYRGRIYGIEVKSYTNETEYYEAAEQAARYGKQLGLSEISLVFFVEYIDDANRKKFEKDFTDEENGVRVTPIFVDTGLWK